MLGIVVAMEREARIVRGAVARAGMQDAIQVGVMGIGPHRARAGARAMLDRGVRGIVVVGFAGALVDGIAAGDLLLPGAVCSPGGSERAIMTMQAKTELDPEGYITIYVDSVNAYNSASRAMMLESVYSDSRLAHLWRAYDFCYSSSSQLLLRQSGTIIDTVASDQGGRQGCVLAGLGYSPSDIAGLIEANVVGG